MITTTDGFLLSSGFGDLQNRRSWYGGHTVSRPAPVSFHGHDRNAVNVAGALKAAEESDLQRKACRLWKPQGSTWYSRRWSSSMVQGFLVRFFSVNFRARANFMRTPASGALGQFFELSI